MQKNKPCHCINLADIKKETVSRPSVLVLKFLSHGEMEKRVKLSINRSNEHIT